MADESAFPKGDLMRGKKGLVMGVANHHSIAYGIASQLAAQGAEMAFTYQGEALERRVRPLAEAIGVKTLIPADVTDDASMDAAFAEIEKSLGTLDFVVHSIAFANKDELKGSFVDNTSRDGFLLAMNISAYSFVDVARRSARLMPNGGSMISMTYLGSERVIPNYAEAALRSIAWEGRFLVIGFPAGIPKIPLNLTLLKGCQIVGVFWGAFTARDPKANQENIRELMELYVAGKIRPHVSERFPLAKAGDAIAWLGSRKAMGKVVVTMD